MTIINPPRPLMEPDIRLNKHSTNQGVLTTILRYLVERKGTEIYSEVWINFCTQIQELKYALLIHSTIFNNNIQIKVWCKYSIGYSCHEKASMSIHLLNTNNHMQAYLKYNANGHWHSLVCTDTPSGQLPLLKVVDDVPIVCSARLTFTSEGCPVWIKCPAVAESGVTCSLLSNSSLEPSWNKRKLTSVSELHLECQSVWWQTKVFCFTYHLEKILSSPHSPLWKTYLLCCLKQDKDKEI